MASLLQAKQLIEFTSVTGVKENIILERSINIIEIILIPDLRIKTTTICGGTNFIMSLLTLMSCCHFCWSWPSVLVTTESSGWGNIQHSLGTWLQWQCNARPTAHTLPSSPQTDDSMATAFVNINIEINTQEAYLVRPHYPNLCLNPSSITIGNFFFVFSTSFWWWMEYLDSLL